MSIALPTRRLKSCTSAIVIALAMAHGDPGLGQELSTDQSGAGPERVIRDLLPGQPLTLPAAFDFARLNSPDLLTDRNNIQRAKLNFENVDSLYVPDVILKLAGNETSGNVSGTENNTTANQGQDQNRLFTELKIELPFWQKDGVLKDARAARKDIVLQQAVLEDSDLGLQKNVYQTYLSLVNEEKKLRISRGILNVIRDNRDAMREAVRIGNASIADLLAQENWYLQQQLEVQTDEQTVRSKRDALTKITGLDGQRYPVCEDVLGMEVFDPGMASVEEAIRQQTRQINIKIDRQIIEKEKAEQRWMPKLSLRGFYNYQQNSSSNNNSNNGNTSTDQDFGGGGIELEIPFPNYSAASAQERLTIQDLSTLYENRDQTKLSTERRLITLQSDLRETMIKITQREDMMKTEEQQVKLAWDNYALGRITLETVRLTENTLERTRKEYLDAIYNYAATVADIRNLLGQAIPLSSACSHSINE